ncbi:DUF2953 domain-containing protein [bacterium]|nr:DUF2953 domain-containing protein [bacterium]
MGYLAGFFILLLLLLLVPVPFRAYLRRDETETEIGLRVIGLNLVGEGSIFKWLKLPKRKPSRKKKREGRNVLKLLRLSFREEELAKRLAVLLFELINDLLASLRIKRLDARGSYGFDDPSLTGSALGLLWALKAGLVSHIERAEVDLLPDFRRSGFFGEVNLCLSLRPVDLLAATTKALFKFPVTRLIKARRRLRQA